MDKACDAAENANEAADAANEAAGLVNEALSNAAEAIDGANAARDAANLAAQEAKEAAATAEEEAEAAHQITLAAQAAAGKADTRRPLPKMQLRRRSPLHPRPIRRRERQILLPGLRTRPHPQPTQPPRRQMKRQTRPTKQRRASPIK